MDTLRGNFGSTGYDGDHDDYDVADDETGHEPPPASIGTDERRMQVRAYNHWASLLDDRNFPSIEDLEPETLEDFGPFSVLLDFTAGIEDPAIQYLGSELAGECGTDAEISQLSDVPSRSLLSRITDHYMQILANQAPIGFEAEFVNQRNATILYRGILLPYSSDGETIDFIYGVINWKEMADQITTDELLLEIDQALEENEPQADDRAEEPVSDWADGPLSDPVETPDAFPEPEFGEESEEDAADDAVVARLSSLIAPRGGAAASSDDDEPDLEAANYSFGIPANDEPVLSVSVDDIVPPKADAPVEEVVAEEPVLEPDPDAGLYDCLAEARELAQHAKSSEDRSRSALYAAVGRAYDVSLAAAEAPEEFAELVEENGLTIQERAPMTPVVKLVFGSDYDKTRLTEYAAVLSHARRAGVEKGGLADFLSAAEGGLKGVVQSERRLRKEEAGKPVSAADEPKPAIVKKLRAMGGQPLDTIDADGKEFGVVMIRRMPDGEVVVLGEVADDIPLVEKVARKLIG